MSIGRGWYEDEVKEEKNKKIEEVKTLAVELLKEKLTICFLKYQENKEKGIDIKMPGSRKGYY